MTSTTGWRSSSLPRRNGAWFAFWPNIGRRSTAAIPTHSPIRGSTNTHCVRGCGRIRSSSTSPTSRSPRAGTHPLANGDDRASHSLSVRHGFDGGGNALEVDNLADHGPDLVREHELVDLGHDPSTQLFGG